LLPPRVCIVCLNRCRVSTIHCLLVTLPWTQLLHPCRERSVAIIRLCQAFKIVEHRIPVGMANCCGVKPQVLPGADQLLCPAEGFGS